MFLTIIMHSTYRYSIERAKAYETFLYSNSVKNTIFKETMDKVVSNLSNKDNIEKELSDQIIKAQSL